MITSIIFCLSLIFTSRFAHDEKVNWAKCLCPTTDVYQEEGLLFPLSWSNLNCWVGYNISMRKTMLSCTRWSCRSLATGRQMIIISESSRWRLKAESCRGLRSRSSSCGVLPVDKCTCADPAEVARQRWQLSLYESGSQAKGPRFKSRLCPRQQRWQDAFRAPPTY